MNIRLKMPSVGEDVEQWELSLLLVQLFGNSKYPLKLKTPPYDLAIPLLDMDSVGIYTPKDELKFSIVVLFIIAKTWKHPICPEWIN